MSCSQSGTTQSVFIRSRIVSSTAYKWGQMKCINTFMIFIHYIRTEGIGLGISYEVIFLLWRDVVEQMHHQTLNHGIKVDISVVAMTYYQSISVNLPSRTREINLPITYWHRVVSVFKYYNPVINGLSPWMTIDRHRDRLVIFRRIVYTCVG